MASRRCVEGDRGSCEGVVEVLVVSWGVLLLSGQKVSRPACKRGKHRGRPAEGLSEPSRELHDFKTSHDRFQRRHLCWSPYSGHSRHAHHPRAVTWSLKNIPPRDVLSIVNTYGEDCSVSHRLHCHVSIPSRWNKPCDEVTLSCEAGRRR
jgi:hypothetical protein